MPFFRSLGRAVLACGDGEKKQKWGQAGATHQRFPQPHRGQVASSPRRTPQVRAPAPCISLATLHRSPGVRKEKQPRSHAGICTPASRAPVLLKSVSAQPWSPGPAPNQGTGSQGDHRLTTFQPRTSKVPLALGCSEHTCFPAQAYEPQTLLSADGVPYQL